MFDWNEEFTELQFKRNSTLSHGRGISFVENKFSKKKKNMINKTINHIKLTITHMMSRPLTYQHDQRFAEKPFVHNLQQFMLSVV